MATVVREAQEVERVSGALERARSEVQALEAEAEKLRRELLEVEEQAVSARYAAALGGPAHEAEAQTERAKALRERLADIEWELPSLRAACERLERRELEARLQAELAACKACLRREPTLRAPVLDGLRSFLRAMQAYAALREQAEAHRTAAVNLSRRLGVELEDEPWPQAVGGASDSWPAAGLMRGAGTAQAYREALERLR
jgi:DNA repair exonuclease SbcCD ATPase subunit